MHDHHRPHWDRARVDRYWQGLIVTCGDDAGYSNTPCESCDQPYAGDRHHVHAHAHDNPTFHLEGTVCTDCLFYLEYGTEPGQDASLAPPRTRTTAPRAA